MLGPVDLTESDSETYNSSSLARFAWDTDPVGKRGLLFVEFNDGREYVYIGVPREEFERMNQLSKPNAGEKTTGEYFMATIVTNYDEKEKDYTTFEEMLEN